LDKVKEGNFLQGYLRMIVDVLLFCRSSLSKSWLPQNLSCIFCKTVIW